MPDFGNAIVASLAAAVLGVMVGTWLIGGDPISGLGLVSLTFVGAFAILLPTYLALQRNRKHSIGTVYSAVLAAGAVGGYAMLALIWLAAAGYNEPDIEPSGIFLIGSLFGAVTAVLWIVAHAVLSTRR